MKLVIIESPYKGDVLRNKRYLRSCIRDCISRNESPYASHRMLTDALDDNDPAERALGIEAGLAWRNTGRIVQKPFAFSDEPARYERVQHVFYVDLGWSGGMLAAKKLYDEERIHYEERKLPPDDRFFLTDEERITGTHIDVQEELERQLEQVRAEGPDRDEGLERLLEQKLSSLVKS